MSTKSSWHCNSVCCSWGHPSDGQVRCTNHHNHIVFSIYSLSIALCLQCFDKRDCLLVYTDDLKSRPEKVLHDTEHGNILTTARTCTTSTTLLEHVRGTWSTTK